MQADKTMPHKPLHARCLRSAGEVEPYLDAWRTLAAGAPMRSPEWLLGWWEVYAGPGDELRLVLVFDDEGGVVGLAPLYRERRGRSRTLRVLGARDKCTHHTDWLTSPGQEAAVGREVAGFLFGSSRDWDRLIFEAADADARAIRATTARLAEQGCPAHRRPVNSCWKIDLPATWDGYLQTLSRSLRKRCRRLQRQYLDSGQVRIRQAQDPQSLREGFAVLLNLHATRWGRPGQELGVFSDRRFRTFHERVSTALLAEGKLRLAWLECDGRPLAVEYQFVDSRAVYAYQAGMDRSMDAYAPGKLSMMAAIRFAISRGCEVFDLLGGDEPYKAHWRAVPVACHDLRVWRAVPRGYLARAAWSGYTLAARRLGPLLPAPLVVRGLRLASALGKIRIFRGGRG